MKQTAKDTILVRIRGAIANAPEPPPVAHDFRERDERDRAAILDDLIDRLIDYKAIVTSTIDTTLPQAIAEACQQTGIIRLVDPSVMSHNWNPVGETHLHTDPPLVF